LPSLNRIYNNCGLVFGLIISTLAATTIHMDDL